MDFRVDSRNKARRQASFLVAALLWAILLLVLGQGALGESAARPEVDDDPMGAPYAAGELLVAYEPGTPEEAEQAVVEESGARTLENPTEQEIRLLSFPAIEAQASEEARERSLARELQDLEGDPRVAAVDYNYLRETSFKPHDPKFDVQWGLKKSKFPPAWDDARGKGARIAIVDSGIYADHPDIGKIAAQKDFVRNDAVANDEEGHGTVMAGVAAALTNNGKGMAGGCPACRLLVAKVVNGRGIAYDSEIVKGIDWSMDHGADVVNLSLGGPARSSVLKRAVNRARMRGAVVVAAAGNERTSRPSYPAAYSTVMAVSATTRSDRLATFSNRGDWVDVAAPGVDILSTRASGGYGRESGTSVAAPFVSALAGLLASEGMSPSRIRNRIEGTATDLGPKGDDRYYGHGRIDAATAVP